MSELPALDLQTLLAASVHELKNSTGLLELLAAQIEEKSQGAANEVAQLRAELARQRQQLVELMALYRMQQQTYPLRCEEVFMDEFCEELALRNRVQLAAAGKQLAWSADSDLCWPVDPQLLGALLDNLVHNALAQGGNRLELRAEACERDGHRWLQIQLDDAGVGFPLALLGEPRPAPGGLDWQQGRTGFGLYFCVQAARQHQRQGRRGRLCLSNRPGGGGRAELLLP